jgi:predicted MFS family arabinose efflux permease
VYRKRACAHEAMAASQVHSLLSRRYKAWLILVLLVVSTLNFSDRAILAVLAQPIKEDLKLSDAALGMLQGLGFAILYSVLGVPLGWLAERFNRKNLIAACVAVWSLMSVACGFAGRFATLLLGRVGVGIGEAGFQPSVSSLLADHFTADRRASVFAIVTLGSPIGFLVGQSAGGWFAAHFSWRAAFFALGVPGLIAALLVCMTVREPPRGLAEGHLAAAPAPPLKLAFRELWSKPTFRHLLVAFTVSGFAFNAMAQFVLTFYLRAFVVPLAVAGAVFGAVSFSSNGLGMLLGAWSFDGLSRRDPRWSAWGPAGALVLAAPLYLLALTSTQTWRFLGLIWFGNFVLISFFAQSVATAQNLVGPRMRALTSALLFMIAGLVGAGLGPTALGVASDFFGSRAFGAADFLASCPGGHAALSAPHTLDRACRAASAQGLRGALICMQIFYFWAAIHYLLAARTLRQDLYAPAASPQLSVSRVN